MVDLSYCRKLNAQAIDILRQSHSALMEKVRFDGCVVVSDQLKEDVMIDDPLPGRQVTYESATVKALYDAAGVYHCDPAHFGYRDFRSSLCYDDRHHNRGSEGVVQKRYHQGGSRSMEVISPLSKPGVFGGELLTYKGRCI